MKIKFMLKSASLLLCLTLIFSVAAFPAEADTVTINVYNWGEYLPDGTDGSMDVNKEFTKATGIKVNYTTFDNNEEMYTKIANGGGDYDIIFPSDYMISKMIDEGLLAKLDYKNIPNAKYIDKEFSHNDYDDGSLYSVPYQWGIVGILYNKTMVDPNDNVNSWDILWNEKYSGKILMFNNSRDAFGVALSKLGYSQNSTDELEWEAAANQLMLQKPLVQAYAMDQIIDKMAMGEAALAPYYAGDALICREDNPDVEIAFPEGSNTNRYVDAMCILASSKHKKEAEAYINFICDPEVSYEVCDFAGYATPNTETYKMLEENGEINEIQYPGEEVLKNTEYFRNLPPNIRELEKNLWSQVRADTSGSVWQIFAIIGAFILVWLIIVVYKRIVRKRKFD